MLRTDLVEIGVYEKGAITGIIKIEITESAEELRKQLKNSDNQELKERIQALYWLKTNQVESTGAMASLTGKHRTTISRWLSKYRKGGLKGLLLFQPPYSPQVNPIERLWQEIKKQLKWQLFENLDDLRNRLSQVLQQLTPQTIKSVTGWDFILEALSVANI